MFTYSQGFVYVCLQKHGRTGGRGGGRILMGIGMIYFKYRKCKRMKNDQETELYIYIYIYMYIISKSKNLELNNIYKTHIENS